ncbi:hypothetical protein ACSSS7_003025 [Eimeria intestinalis]
METVVFKWPAAWRLAQPLPAAERGALIGQVEAGAALLLHMRDDALKRQLENDKDLQEWLLLRTFLRLGRLQDPRIHQQQLLPSTACLDVCLSWEVAEPVLCSEVAAALLESLKPSKKERLLEELRESLPAALEAAATSLTALGRRHDSPMLLPTGAAGGAASAADGGIQPAWMSAAAAALQPLLEALATLRAATCCLPTSFALQLWQRDRPPPSAVEAMINSFLKGAPQQAHAATPFAAPLMRVYGALMRPPWAAPSGPSASLLPPSLHRAVARARVLCCSCLVGDAAAQSEAVRKELKASLSRRPSRWLAQQAEELLQEWGASLLQLFEAASGDGGAADCTISDLTACGACRLLQQWRALNEPETAESKKALVVPAESPKNGEASWGLSSEDAKTISQLQDMLPEHGPGYLYLALRELRGNAEEVASMLLENKTLAGLRSVPLQATLEGKCFSTRRPVTAAPSNRRYGCLHVCTTVTTWARLWSSSIPNSNCLYVLTQMLRHFWRRRQRERCHLKNYPPLVLSSSVEFLLSRKLACMCSLIALFQAALTTLSSSCKPCLLCCARELRERVAEEALEDGSESSSLLYDDDADEEILAEAAAAPRSADESEVEESSSSEESEKQAPDGGAPSRGGHMPVRGGTLAARRKEAHKASVGNHSRRNQ